MNWADVFVTAGATAGLGFIAFVVGQLVLTLIVEPVQEQARIVGIENLPQTQIASPRSSNVHTQNPVAAHTRLQTLVPSR